MSGRKHLRCSLGLFARPGSNHLAKLRTTKPKLGHFWVKAVCLFVLLLLALTNADHLSEFSGKPRKIESIKVTIVCFLIFHILFSQYKKLIIRRLNQLKDDDDDDDDGVTTVISAERITFSLYCLIAWIVQTTLFLSTLFVFPDEFDQKLHPVFNIDWTSKEGVGGFQLRLVPQQQTIQNSV